MRLFRGRRVHLRRPVHRGASNGSTAYESLSCKQVYGHHFLGAPHASSFCFFWRAPSMAAPMGWRVLPSLVVLGLPLPLPRLSRRDRLIMCKSPPSLRNIAQLLLLQVLALCRTKTLGNRSLQFRAPSTTAAPPRGDTDAGSRTIGVLAPWGPPARSKRRCEDREFSIGVGCVYLAVPGEPWLAGVCLASPP